MKVILNIPVACPLSPDEVDRVRQLLRDALGEFVGARGGHGIEEPGATIQYVNKRYPDLRGYARDQKIDEVMERKRLAQKLLYGVDKLEVEDGSSQLTRIRDAALCARDGTITHEELINVVLARTAP
jgi:hypothetical protein